MHQSPDMKIEIQEVILYMSTNRGKGEGQGGTRSTHSHKDRGAMLLLSDIGTENLLEPQATHGAIWR